MQSIARSKINLINSEKKILGLSVFGNAGIHQRGHNRNGTPISPGSLTKLGKMKNDESAVGGAMLQKDVQTYLFYIYI